ncbi:hypothetical protein RHMOL_Rhmol10G0097800 [Rhododendron molle]|uniref:Uncharacterized protein n=1 Tax=Rhododendron molle TaxID=49168 RepID=A0ACC0M0Q6_RHOML|nr:hypothetical protein RHMOL_Rhmol10G0097800 [Rhododendron molle]
MIVGRNQHTKMTRNCRPLGSYTLHDHASKLSLTTAKTNHFAYLFRDNLQQTDVRKKQIYNRHPHLRPQPPNSLVNPTLQPPKTAETFTTAGSH